MATRNTGARYAAARPSAGRYTNVRSRRRPSTRFFIITGVFVFSVVILLVLLLSPLPTAAAQWASTGYTADFDMLIVRDEVVYEATNYGKTEFIAQEGSHIETGEPILKVYKLGYNEGTLSELFDLQKTIMNYETNVIKAGVIDQSLNDINSRIDLKAKEIQTSVSAGQSESLLGLEGDMKSLLNERTAHLNNSQPDAQLRQYFNRQQELKNQINGWCSVVAAETAGKVSFYFDGCESVMTKDIIGKFTRKALEEVSAGKTLSISDEDQERKPLYRVVSEDKWYVVLLADKKIPEMFQGNVFTMVFDDYLDKQYTGSVYNIQELENHDGYVYTIEIDGSIGPMLGDRRVSAKLAAAIQGWRIPKSCLKLEDGVSYVETASGRNVPVFVVGSEGDNVFVQTYKDQASLSENELLKK